MRTRFPFLRPFRRRAVFGLTWGLLGAFALLAGGKETSSQQNATGPPAHYQVTDLGLLEGTTYISSAAINESDEIVGSTMVGASEHAFQWKEGKLADLGTGGNPSSSATGINTTGLIVGSILTAQTTARAVFWKQGTMQTLPLLPGRKMNMALAVNDKGQIAGYMGDNASMNDVAKMHQRACLWDGEKATDLGTLSGDKFSAAQGINASGQIVGYSMKEPRHSRACLWEGKKKVELPVKAPSSQAKGVNDKGAVIGDFQVQPDALIYHAFLYREDKVTDLGVLTGCDFSIANGINSAMQVVGRSGTHDAAGTRAFLWNNGTMVDLNTLIDSKSGWVLQEARAINGRGEITGNGSLNGKRHAFLLTPQ
jgi:probable HAF family extracellular repeat protein